MSHVTCTPRPLLGVARSEPKVIWTVEDPGTVTHGRWGLCVECGDKGPYVLNRISEAHVYRYNIHHLQNHEAMIQIQKKDHSESIVVIF